MGVWSDTVLEVTCAVSRARRAGPAGAIDFWRRVDSKARPIARGYHNEWVPDRARGGNILRPGCRPRPSAGPNPGENTPRRKRRIRADALRKWPPLRPVGRLQQAGAPVPRCPRPAPGRRGTKLL